MNRNHVQIAALSGVALVGTVLGVLSTGTGLVRAQSDTIRGPAEWIPYSLEFTVTNSYSKVTLQQYRRADGSTRQDQADYGATTINDVSNLRYYRLEKGQWNQHPLAAPPFDGRPFTTLSRRNVTEVSRDDPRVRVVAEAVPEATFYQLAKRTTAILCPELNMLLVWAHTEQGAIHETTGLLVGEPAVAFEPPNGASVVIRTEVKGGPMFEMPSVTNARKGGRPPE